MNYRNVLTGSDDGSPNYTEQFKCRHCDKWVDEAEEDGDTYLCLTCLTEHAKCSRCGRYEVITDMSDGLCYECDKDDRIQAAMDDYKAIVEENRRTNWAITDTLHKHAGIVYSVLHSEVERRKANSRKENK